MTRPKAQHIHKYQRVKWGKKETVVLRCMLPACPHYVHEEMASGRKSICWKCGSQFVLTTASILKKKPKCPNCTTKKQDDPILARLDGLLEGLE